MSKYFERLFYKRTVKSEHFIENHKVSNQLSMTGTFIEIQSEHIENHSISNKLISFFRKLYKIPSSRRYASCYTFKSQFEIF